MHVKLETGFLPNDVMDIVHGDPYLSSLSTIDSVSPVPGGVSHRVYQISSQGKAYYLKIRGSHFAQIPSIACNPADIVYEHNALVTFKQLAPENFPTVVSFSPEGHYLVLSDGTPQGQKLETMFLNNEVTAPMLFTLGKTLKRIHHLAASYTEPLRGEGEAAYYDAKLDHRFGYRHHPTLDAIVENLGTMNSKQLILGDPAPKNIGANDSGQHYIFFDLEEAHVGDPVFDFAYTLGHIAMHTFSQPAKAAEAIQAYENGYDSHRFDPDMVKKMALGIMLYRLGSIIPYPTCLDSVQSAAMQEKIEKILPFDLSNTGWIDILSIIQNE